MYGLYKRCKLSFHLELVASSSIDATPLARQSNYRIDIHNHNAHLLNYLHDTKAASTRPAYYTRAISIQAR